MTLQTEPVGWTAIEKALHDWIEISSGFAGNRVIWADQGGKRPTDVDAKTRVPYISMNIQSVAEAGLDWTDWEVNTLSFADVTITAVDTVTNVFTAVAHGLLTGDGPAKITTTGTVPGGLVVNTNYWVIRVDADHFKLATNYLNSINPWDGSAPIAIDITSAGTGVNKLVKTAFSERSGQELIAKTRAQWVATMSIQCIAVDATGVTDAVSTLTKVMMKARTIPIILALNAAGIGVSDFTPVKSIGRAISMTIFEPRATVDFKFFLAAQVEDYQTYIARVRYQNELTGKITEVERPDA